MSEIIELTNMPIFLEENNQSFLGSRMLTETVPGVPKSIFKFRLSSICEVFGYQMAEAVGVRVPQMQAFWVSTDVKTGEIKAMPGRIGILVKYHEDWKPLCREDAVRLDVAQVVRALTLCVFDRNEWGEFGLCGGKVYFIDLEYLLPLLAPETLLAASKSDRMNMLNDLASKYGRSDFTAIGGVLEEAKLLEIEDQVELELQRLCQLELDTCYWFLKISGHPLDKLLSCFATTVFVQRLNTIARWFGLPQHKSPDW